MKGKKYTRVDLAMNQFETAVALFLTHKDYFSAIILAGAADVIFCQMITRSGKENFTDVLVKSESKGRSREEVGSEVNDLLDINVLKHLDPGDDEFVTLNAFESAYTTILKGLVNYNMLEGSDPKVKKDFLEWVKNNLDPKIYNIHCL